MSDLPQFLLFMAAVLIPAAVLLFWLDYIGALYNLQAAATIWLREHYLKFNEAMHVRRFKQNRGLWIPAAVGEADRKALLLHDIELGTNRSLLVSFDNIVYVTRRQRREINRYLQGSHFARGEAAEVFADHGYQLITTRH